MTVKISASDFQNICESVYLRSGNIIDDCQSINQARDRLLRAVLLEVRRRKGDDSDGIVPMPGLTDVQLYINTIQKELAGDIRNIGYDFLLVMKNSLFDRIWSHANVLGE